MNKSIKSIILSITLIMFSISSYSCTVIFVGKKATVDGSVIVSHSNDGFYDARLMFIPSADHKPNTKLPIYYSSQAMGYLPEFKGVPYRDYVNNEKGSPYNTGEQLSKPLGYIPQVEHTYAYLTTLYPVMNEHQLSIGESTCETKVNPMPKQNKRTMYSSQLTAIAMQRCKTAKEAVILTGELIKKYGYYGTGEAIIYADKNEGWLMEMCGYDNNETDGIWVAERIPDDSVCVIANQFRIQEVRQEDFNFLYSDNLFEVCQKKKWWNPSQGDLNWQKAVTNGEFRHPYYSLRRVWRVLDIIKPSAKFTPWVEGPFTKKYPLFVKPDKKLSVKDIIAIHRDYYQGTQFDLTKGKAAGIYHNPTRYDLNLSSGNSKIADAGKNTKGGRERSIASFRCNYYHVNQMRDFLPDAIGGVTWFGFDKPAETCVMPVYAGVNSLPMSFSEGDYMHYDYNSAWWTFNFLANYVTLRYSDMIKDVNKVQKSIEDKEFKMQPSIEETALNLFSKHEDNLAKEFLTMYVKYNAESVINKWRQLTKSLIVKYNDGYTIDSKSHRANRTYPANYLKETGYTGALQSYKKPN